jgi:hypothetical protein
VNIVPTLYWYDPASQKLQTGVCNAEAWAENQVVDHYCDKWEWDSPCEAFSWDKVSRWETGMKDCIKKVRPGANRGLAGGGCALCNCGREAAREVGNSTA